MSEIELIKVVIHKLANIEATLEKQVELNEIYDQLYKHEELMKKIQNSLQELKVNIEVKHIENMNSDDMLIRSILDQKALHYKWD